MVWFTFCLIPSWSNSILVLFHISLIQFQSYSILVWFDFGLNPFLSYSIFVLFHFGSYSILVLFHFGLILFWSYPILIIGLIPFLADSSSLLFHWRNKKTIGSMKIPLDGVPIGRWHCSWAFSGAPLVKQKWSKSRGLWLHSTNVVIHLNFTFFQF